MFKSEIQEVGTVELPKFSGVRVMMLPFRLEDVATLPSSVASWRQTVAALIEMSPVRSGVAYLTIDESEVLTGETHRRPGLHVDGIGPDGRAAAWGGGGKYAASGMLLVSNIVGCRGWSSEFSGYPGLNGDCEHLSDECYAKEAIVMRPGQVYFCGPLAVHEALPMRKIVKRQVCRLSMPNDCPWYEGYTRNPLGVEPTGSIHAPRSGFMAYRS